MLKKVKKMQKSGRMPDMGALGGAGGAMPDPAEMAKGLKLPPGFKF